MTDDSITEMILRIQQGETGLEEALWHTIEKLVQWYARKYFARVTVGGPAPNGVEIEDLYQCGYLAMIDAVKDYDPQLGAFSTLLLVHLRKHFRQAIGGTEKQLHDPLNNSYSLDAPINSADPESILLLETIPDPDDYYKEIENKIYQKQLHDELEQAIDMLPKKEAAALRSKYWDGSSLADTATELGVSLQRAQQLQKDGLRHIRKSSEISKLEQFLDDHTAFYRPISVNSFIRTHSSSVEMNVLRREELRIRYEKSMKRLGLLEDHKRSRIQILKNGKCWTTWK